MALRRAGVQNQTSIYANNTFKAFKEAIYQNQDVSKVVLSAETFRFVLMTKKNEVKLIKQSPTFALVKKLNIQSGNQIKGPCRAGSMWPLKKHFRKEY